jgi:hypothetical protein
MKDLVKPGLFLYGYTVKETFLSNTTSGLFPPLCFGMGTRLRLVIALPPASVVCYISPCLISRYVNIFFPANLFSGTIQLDGHPDVSFRYFRFNLQLRPRRQGTRSGSPVRYHYHARPSLQMPVTQFDAKARVLP